MATKFIVTRENLIWLFSNTIHYFFARCELEILINEKTHIKDAIDLLHDRAKKHQQYLVH